MQHFSIRKLSIGAASVLIGISFLGVKASTVKADSLQNASKAELTKSKAANEAIKQDISSNIEQDTGSNIKQEPTSDIKKDTSSNIEQDTGSNIKQDTGSNIKQETASKVDTKQITNDHPNTAQMSAQPVTPKPNSNQQNAADLEAKPQTSVKDKLQTNSVIIPNKADQSKVRVTNLMAIAGKKLSPNLLAESKVMTPAKDTNGGFDEATWGKLDVNDWQGNVQGDYYQLTDYTGDANHVIVPNEADFEKAGISTSGKQVGVTSDLMKHIFKDKATAQDATVAFSKTDNKMVKAINADWKDTWGHQYSYSRANLSKFDGTNLDVSNVINMSYMFRGNRISNLSSLSNWNVNNVTDMSYIFSDNSISDLSPLSSWKVDNVSDMRGMFNENQISDLDPLANWDVSNVTNMSDMFNTNQISNLSPLAHWNVSSVINMFQMFCINSISDLSPLANWNITKVTDLGYMFVGNQISDLSPLVNWKVDNVENMSNIFQHNQIKDLSPLANWHVNNVTDMSGMFKNNQISDLSSLANWKTNHVTGMGEMFVGNQISDLSPLAKWNVDNVKNMSSLFEKNQIRDLSPLANWHTNNVIAMNNMFHKNQISDLTPLSNWKVDNVEDMSYMFSDNKISSLSPLANWNVDNVQGMSSLFEENQISDLTPLAGWHTNNVGMFDGMFANNRIGDVSPLANWNTDNVSQIYGIFDNNSSIQTKTTPAKRIINFVYPAGYTSKKQNSITQTIDVPTEKVKVELTTNKSTTSYKILDWVTKTETPISKITDPAYFQDYTVPAIKGLLEPDQTVIKEQQADITKPINVTVTYKLAESNTNDAFALDSKNGLHEHANVNDNGGYDSDYWGKINVDNWNYTVNGDRIEINSLKDGISTGANDAVIVPNLDDFKLAGKDGGAKTVYISGYTLGKTAKRKYYGLSKTNGNTFATDSDLSLVFYKNSNLTHADLNSLNTSNATDMTYMFSNAKSLTDLDVSNWNTSNVTNMTAMFIGASSLTNLDVSNWNTSNVTNMGRMFTNASNLTNLDVSYWDTGKVTDMHAMFYNASSLTSLDVSNWNTSNVTNMGRMFAGARSLKSLDVSKWDTSKVSNMYGMFSDANSLMSLDVSNWKTGNVTDMGWMFTDTHSLTSLDVSHWDISKVIDMGLMFYGTRRLTSLDVSNWDTSKVTDMHWMFDGARSLMSLDVSNWDTGNVTNMSYMFYGTNNLALIVNGDKFADYLVKNNFANSNVDSDVKSVTTDNPKLLKLLTNDSQHNSAIRTIALMLPVGYNPDLVKYHLIKVGNTYQIKQFADYDKPYLQGTVLINATNNIDDHHIDTTKPNKLTDTWQPNYNKLVLAHKNNDGTVSFDAVQLPKVPGYKAVIRYESPKVAEAINPRAMLFRVSYIAIPKKPIEPTVKPDEPTAITPIKPTVKPIESTAKPDEPTAITPIKPATKLDKPDVTPSKPDVQNHLSDRNTQTPVTVADNAVVSQNVDSVDFDWKIDTKMGFDNGKRQAVAFEVSNSDYSLNLPYVNNSKLHLIKQYTTKDAVSFAYVGQNSEYVFNIKFVNGHYLLTTYKIKSGKLVKLIDYNFVKSSKMIKVILDWLQLK